MEKECHYFLMREHRKFININIPYMGTIWECRSRMGILAECISRKLCYENNVEVIITSSEDFDCKVAL